MKFVSYPKMQNLFRMDRTINQKFLNKIAEENLTGGEWMVSEKIHGSNFSIWTDGEDVRFGKRSGFIGTDQDFMNCLRVISRDDLIKKVKIVFRQMNPEVAYMGFYGEIFGGAYPHPDVEKNKFAKKVQKGVYYSPVNHIRFFDVRVVMKDNTTVFWPKYNVYSFINIYGLKAVPLLHKGTYEECLEYPNDKPSVVYKEWDLPEIEDNIMEGIVIEPIEPQFLFDHTRVKLKSKNAKHMEKSKEPREKREKQIPIDLTPEAQNHLLALTEYIAENRLKNVLSHIGTVNAKQFGKVCGLLVQDCVSEYEDETYKDFDPEQRHAIQKRLFKLAQEFVRKYWMDILDGDF